MQSGATAILHVNTQRVAILRLGRQQSFHLISGFLGQADDASGILLSETNLITLYPTLLDDLQLAAADRTSIRQVITVPSRSGPPVKTAIVLTAAKNDRAVTAGDIYLALYPVE